MLFTSDPQHCRADFSSRGTDAVDSRVDRSYAAQIEEGLMIVQKYAVSQSAFSRQQLGKTKEITC